MAQLTSATILGAIAWVRAGKAVGWSYIGGLTAARLIQGLIGLDAITAIVSDALGFLDLEQYGAVRLLLGAAALVFAFARELVRGREGQDEESKGPDEEGVSPRGAFTWGFGATIVSARQWIFTSIALTSIDQLQVGLAGSLALWVGYLAAASWLAVSLLVLRYPRPKSASGIIDKAAAWTHKNMGTTSLGWGSS